MQFIHPFLYNNLTIALGIFSDVLSEKNRKQKKADVSADWLIGSLIGSLIDWLIDRLIDWLRLQKLLSGFMHVLLHSTQQKHEEKKRSWKLFEFYTTMTALWEPQTDQQAAASSHNPAAPSPNSLSLTRPSDPVGSGSTPRLPSRYHWSSSDWQTRWVPRF